MQRHTHASDPRASTSVARGYGRHPAASVEEGKHQVEDFDFSYGLYVDVGRVACFAEGRIGYREWARRNGRLSDIHTIDDRYDHDIDELMM